MKPYTHPKDEGLLLKRTVGKKRRPAAYKRAAVAKLAPHELDDQPEDTIRAQVQADIEATGLPYPTLEDADLGWLKQMAPTDYHAARLLDALKDLPDFTVWRPAPGQPYALSLPLELKVLGKGGRPGQRAFREAAGGFITQGYTEPRAVLSRFLAAITPNPENP